MNIIDWEFMILVFLILIQVFLIILFMVIVVMVFVIIGGFIFVFIIKNKILVFYQLLKLYIFFFRGVLIFVQLFLIYYGLLQLFLEMSKMIVFIVVIIGLSLKNVVYLVEIFCVVFNFVDDGQFEVCLFVGMIKFQVYRWIILL